jgi:hypothetical protein
MFGRKRKQEQEDVGLAGLGSAGTAPNFGPAPNVSVSAVPAPEPGAAPPTQPSPPTPGAIPGLAPGMVPTNAAAMLGQILSGHGPVGELVAQIKADPEGFRQRIMQQAQAAGISTYVMSPQWLAQAGAGGPGQIGQPQHVDVIDELTKAADLHHQGALTDAEFEALKKKLLSE